MAWSEYAPLMKKDRRVGSRAAKPPAPVGADEELSKLFNTIFSANVAVPAGAPVIVSNIGRIASMPLPSHWVQGDDIVANTGYGRAYHPREQNKKGQIAENDDVQLVFTLRSHPLSKDATIAFRAMLDFAFVDSNGMPLESSTVQRAPLNEVLGACGQQKAFTVFTVRVQCLNGEPALLVDGKYNNSDVSVRIVYIDAEGNDGEFAAVQQIALIAPTSSFFKYATAASTAIENIVWKEKSHDVNYGVTPVEMFD